MTPTLLYLVTPIVEDPAAFAPTLRAATRDGAAAAVLLRLPLREERLLINHVKALSPIAQEAGAALVVSVEGRGGAAEAIDIGRVATRGGADGVHARDLAEARLLRERLESDRIVGVGGLKTRHDAMTAGEIGVDYVLFGEPRPDGSLPGLETVHERAAWWAEIFETPCVAFAPSLDAVAALAETGAEFVALGEAAFADPAGPADALARARATLDAADAERARRATEDGS
ncbi:thiamine phosphate synthase [Salinarimonas rosea]|uniref:thiamine phosphate synthase n=1 Tax=Salinarimonas rosea TaxID=552063 RepID=UPI000425E419|nr:thiamine phosphate synthase [Salinarimonas rosea]